MDSHNHNWIVGWNLQYNPLPVVLVPLALALFYFPWWCRCLRPLSTLDHFWYTCATCSWYHFHSYSSEKMIFGPILAQLLTLCDDNLILFGCPRSMDDLLVQSAIVSVTTLSCCASWQVFGNLVPAFDMFRANKASKCFILLRSEALPQSAGLSLFKRGFHDERQHKCCHWSDEISIIKSSIHLI